MMKFIRKTFFGITLLSATLGAYGTAFAQENRVYLLSERLPLIGENSVVPDLPTLFNQLLGISVGFAAAMAVIMLTVGGFKYMTSESMFSMGSAKEQITNAVVGLLIVLSAVLILSYINPDLVSLRFFQAG